MGNMRTLQVIIAQRFQASKDSNGTDTCRNGKSVIRSVTTSLIYRFSKARGTCTLYNKCALVTSGEGEETVSRRRFI